VKEFIVQLSDAETKALEYVAFNAQEWIENVVRERCRVAMEEIFQLEVQRMLKDPLISEIPADRDAVVLMANVKSGRERQEVFQQAIENQDNGV